MSSDELKDAPPQSKGLPSWVWPAFAVLFPTLAMSGAFSLSSVFFIRDLSMNYWPAHLWLRKVLLSGGSPSWDPYIAFGQPAINDPTRQILFLPTLPLRLLFPEVIGYNLSVALAVPLAALGAYLFLRRHAGRASASLGAVVFAVSGPLLSSANFLNLIWAAACIPWVLWGVGRICEGATTLRIALLALLFALQATAGEPVTLATTALLAAGYSGMGFGKERLSLAMRAKQVGLTCLSGVFGALLAAPQLLPMLESDRTSFRTSDVFKQSAANPPLHPLTLVEVVAPNLFVDSFAPVAQFEPWMFPLNHGVAPFFVSVYLGAGVLTLAFLGALTSRERHRSLFWAAVFLVAVLCALGDHTPLYPILQAAFPPLSRLRFPPKYLLIAAMAAATLVAAGWDEILATAAAGRRNASIRAAVILALIIASGAGLVALFVVALPSAALEQFVRLAETARLARPDLGAQYLAESAARIVPGVFALSLAIAASLWLATSRRPEALLGRAGLFLIIVCDLLAKNLGVNPTIDARLLGEPSWTQAMREHPKDRVYVGGRLSFVVGNADIDDLPEIEGVNPKASRQVVETIRRARAGGHIPGAWGLREAVSVDMTLQWPVDYWNMLLRFKRSPAEARIRYLERVAVRYFLTPRVIDGARVVEPSFGSEFMRVYERPPLARAFVVTSAEIEPSVERQTERMFSAEFDPRAAVLLREAAPEPSGVPGTPAPAKAEIIEDGSTTVVVRAGVPEGGGFLVLSDTYDSNWRVEVDGRSGLLLRANGLFRSVHLAPGEHEVRFSYRSLPLMNGLVVSGLTTLALGALAWIEAHILKRRT